MSADHALTTALFCPEWCELDDDGHATRTDHIDGSTVHIRSFGGSSWSVTISQVNDRDGAVSQLAGIDVENAGHELRPVEARQLAQAILEAAAIADGSQAYLRRGIGASVAACMVDHGLTPARLAEVIGMSEGNLWRRLSGASGFTAEDMVRLARALDVEVGELLT